MSAADGVYRAIWPIHDPRLPLDLSMETARRELPTLARRAHVRLLAEPHWSIEEGRRVPGSAGAPWVIVAICPAEHQTKAAA